MMIQKKYTDIYVAHDTKGFIHLCLHNPLLGYALFFDGLQFVYKPVVKGIPAGFERLKNGAPSYQVEMLKQCDDLTFLKFTDETIFQIHFMPYGNAELRQVLSIFKKDADSSISTPLGCSVWDAAIMRLNRAEKCDVRIEP